MTSAPERVSIFPSLSESFLVPVTVTETFFKGLVIVGAKSNFAVSPTTITAGGTTSADLTFSQIVERVPLTV